MSTRQSFGLRGISYTKGSIWAEDPWLPPLVYHPQSHGIPASHNPKLLDLFTFLAIRTASALPTHRLPPHPPNAPYGPSVPRSPSVHKKKSQENFEKEGGIKRGRLRRGMYHPELVGLWIGYLERYQVGVGMRTVRWG